jgi:hypothetical protein
MNTGARQFACVVIGWDVERMFLRNDFDAAFTPLNIDGPFDIRATVIFQPEINWNSHENYSPC